MNVKDFYRYIEHPEQLNASTVAELQEVLEVYPYFQTAHFLYLKSLYNQSNFKFNDQLKLSSVHVNNRKKLLFYLKDKSSSELNQELPEKKISTEKQKTVINTREKQDKTPIVIKEVKPKEKLLEDEVKPSLTPEAVIQKEVSEKPKEIQEKEASSSLKEQVVKPVPDKKNDVRGTSSLKVEKVESQKEVKDKGKPKRIQESLKEDTLKGQKKESLDSKTLTPQEILLKRIQEIQNAKKEVSTVTESVSKKDLKVDNENPISKREQKETEPKQKGNDVGVEQREGPKETFKAAEPKLKKEPYNKKRIDSKLIEEKEDGDVLVELPELIQIAPPAEYFIEGEAEAEEVGPIGLEKQASSSKQSFAYWINHLQNSKTQKDNKREPVQNQKKEEVKKKSNLIDSFLSDKRPKTIKPDKKLEIKSAFEQKEKDEDAGEGLMTETLAQIYIKQAYYEKAIEAYVKLSLKYPKKNIYFASQIEKVKKLQLNS